MIEVAFVRPVLFSLFGLNIYSYGLMVGLALYACTFAFSHDLERLNINADASLFMLAFIPGFGVGSKLQMFISAYFSGETAHLGLDHGHSFMGSAIGGVMCCAAYGRYCGMGLLQLLDFIIPLVPLGHGIGKWGCFLSGDGCYGKPSNMPWAMSFPNAARPTRQSVHPTPLYESFLSLAVFGIVHFGLSIPKLGDRAKLPVGRRAALCLTLYGIVRMVVEPFRRHPAIEQLWGLTECQFLAVIFILLAFVITFFSKRSEAWPAGLINMQIVAESSAEEQDEASKTAAPKKNAKKGKKAQ